MASGGYKSLLVSWIGGANAPQSQASVRSLIAFWMGGGSSRSQRHYVNPRARWIIPSPVIHNAEQAVVQKKISRKIKAIERVETKLHKYGELKKLLEQLKRFEQELDRLIDLFEFNAQQAIKQEMQIAEEEIIIISFVI